MGTKHIHVPTYKETPTHPHILSHNMYVLSVYVYDSFLSMEDTFHKQINILVLGFLCPSILSKNIVKVTAA